MASCRSALVAVEMVSWALVSVNSFSRGVDMGRWASAEIGLVVCLNTCTQDLLYIGL